MTEDSPLFEYTLSDAWDRKLSHVAVYDGEQPFVRFSSNKDGFYSLFESEKTIIIDAITIVEIKAVLQSLNISALDELTHVVVSDGYEHSISYYIGDKQIILTGYNLRYCQEEPKLYPNSMIMIRALKKIGKILSLLGVERKCFALVG